MLKDKDYPDLSMSRSIGDKVAHKIGVSDIPEIKKFRIPNSLYPLAVIIASDDVWECMFNDEVKDIVLNYIYSKDANSCAKTIVEKVRIIWKKSRYSIDDITCVVGFFDII